MLDCIIRLKAGLAYMKMIHLSNIFKISCDCLNIDQCLPNPEAFVLVRIS